MTPIASEPPVMPPAIVAVAKSRTCSAMQRVVTHTPVLRVEASVSGDSLRLGIALLSLVGTSTKPDAFHAFVSVDGHPVVLSLPPQGFISLTYPGLSPGVHYVRYGVYRGDQLLEDNSFCRNVQSSRRSR
jgi:hypothetical protein